MTAVDDVKQRLDIVACISRYVPLQKAGRNFRARCPFHQEKTPSFYVFPDGQSWHCFGACGTGGDVFTFVMKKENVPFGEALRLLAEQAGVTLPERSAGEDTHDGAVRARLLQAMEEAAQYYHGHLLQGSDAGKAQAYLQGRGLTAETLRMFLLGYSPEGWGVLHRQLRERGFSDDELIEAGLVIPGESGLHDRFRGRVMFPLRDARGRVVGFGARTLDGSPPKYVNSPQTPLFDKGSLLYGWDLAREAVRREGRVVIVEGYIDAIMAHQTGFSNVVASMGTALTERQVGLLRGVARQIVLALDADAAGAEATLRGVTVLAETVDRKVVPVPVPEESRRGLRVLIRYEQRIDTEIRVAVLSDGKDPDEIIRKNPETWRTLVADSLPVLDYVLTTATAGLDPRQPRDVSRAAEQVLPFIVEIRDPIRRAHAVQRLARLLQIDERALQDRIREVVPADERRDRGRAGRERAAQSGAPADERGTSRPADRWDQVEELCLALLLQHPECAEAAAGLHEDHFSLPERQAILAAWRAAGGFPQFWDTVEIALYEDVSHLLSLPLPPGSTPDRAAALHQCWRRLEERRLRRAKTQQTRLLQEPGDQAEAVSRLSLALWRGQVLPAEGSEAGESLWSLAEAQRQGLLINARLRAIFYDETETTPSEHREHEGEKHDG